MSPSQKDWKPKKQPEDHESIKKDQETFILYAQIQKYWLRNSENYLPVAKIDISKLFAYL